MSGNAAVASADALSEIRFGADGLIAAVAQDAGTGRVLMLAWMNRDALLRTLETGEAHYWSRSRSKLWRKGEESGHVQRIRAVRLDCDGDAVLLEVEPAGGLACHTGRASCFYRRFENGNWHTVDPVVRDPELIYKR